MRHLCLLAIYLRDNPLFNPYADALNHRVVAVAGGVVAVAHVHTEESPEGLPEACPEGSHKSLDDVVALLVGLTVYQFYQCLTLILSEFLHLGLILVKDCLLKSFQVVFFLFL